MLNIPYKLSSTGAFAKMLQSFGVDLTDWGKNGHKNVSDMLTELEEKDSRLYILDGRLIRYLRVVKMIVRNQDGRFLKEVQQIRPDGNIKTFNSPRLPSGKIKRSEAIYTALLRESQEELGLDAHSLGKWKRMTRWTESKPSTFYPTMPTVQELHFYSINLPPKQQIELRRTEEDGKTIIFDWFAGPPY